jgi:uncharacterized Zn-finger protein
VSTFGLCSGFVTTCANFLSSHTNVHSSNRPHYCPVKDCPRGEGGKGFKRKNEMIRHGLVHQSPGYVCPFCPDREHKYPRPDNLQRYVTISNQAVTQTDSNLAGMYVYITWTRTKMIPCYVTSLPSDQRVAAADGGDE